MTEGEAAPGTDLRSLCLQHPRAQWLLHVRPTYSREHRLLLFETPPDTRSSTSGIKSGQPGLLGAVDFWGCLQNTHKAGRGDQREEQVKAVPQGFYSKATEGLDLVLSPKGHSGCCVDIGLGGRGWGTRLEAGVQLGGYPL